MVIIDIIEIRYRTKESSHPETKEVFNNYSQSLKTMASFNIFHTFQTRQSQFRKAKVEKTVSCTRSYKTCHILKWCYVGRLPDGGSTAETIQPAGKDN